MVNDLKDLEDRIKQARLDGKDDTSDDKQNADRQTGMRAGSEFMAYIISGGIVGWACGHFFGNMPLWLIFFVFAGFLMGIWRASQLMK